MKRGQLTFVPLADVRAALIAILIVPLAVGVGVHLDAILIRSRPHLGRLTIGPMDVVYRGAVSVLEATWM